MALGAVLTLGSAACESTPMRTFQGARAYSEGSESLEHGDYAAAVVALEEAARLVPHASEVQNHLGLAHWGSGNVAQAEIAFARALELDCDNSAARRNADALQVALSASDSSRSFPPDSPLSSAPSATRSPSQPEPAEAAFGTSVDERKVTVDETGSQHGG